MMLPLDEVELLFFLDDMNSLEMNLLELVTIGVGGGGINGSSFREGSNFVGGVCFLGIPGNFSQENGIPENLSGVAGLDGE